MSSERKCPHCGGDLSRYEDPAAVAIIAEKDEKIQRLTDALAEALECFYSEHSPTSSSLGDMECALNGQRITDP